MIEATRYGEGFMVKLDDGVPLYNFLGKHPGTEFNRPLITSIRENLLTYIDDAQPPLLALSPRAAYSLYSALATVKVAEMDELREAMIDMLGMRDAVTATRLRTEAEAAERQKRRWNLPSFAREVRERMRPSIDPSRTAQKPPEYRPGRKAPVTVAEGKRRQRAQKAAPKDELILGDNSAQLRALAERQKEDA